MIGNEAFEFGAIIWPQGFVWPNSSQSVSNSTWIGCSRVFKNSKFLIDTDLTATSPKSMTEGS